MSDTGALLLMLAVGLWLGAAGVAVCQCSRYAVLRRLGRGWVRQFVDPDYDCPVCPLGSWWRM